MERLTIFKRLRANPVLVWWMDIKSFAVFLFRYLKKRLLEGMGHFETGKDVVVEGLVAQRGRYARPFLHTGMIGLFLIGLMLAPILKGAVAGEDGIGGSILGVIGLDLAGITTEVSVKPRDSVVTYIVQTGDTVSSIAKKFDVSPQQIVNWPFNSYADDETFALAVGQILIVPDGIKPAEILWDPKRYVARSTPDAGVVSATGQFVWPAAGRISQRSVWYHRAIDIANKAGPSVLAADSGRVVVAGWPDGFGYGNRVIIDHGNGFQTLYGHLASVSVGVGQTVSRGNVIGRMGSSGRSSGVHLHFEIRAGGGLVDPLVYLK